MALLSFEKRVGANSAERTVRKLPTKVLLAAAVRWDVSHSTEVQRLHWNFFQKISHERNCSSSSRPMWQPDWRQVLGDHLRWARCRPDWNLPRRFRLTTRTSQRLLQWGLWWKIRSPCCSRRSWTRHYGLRSVRTLRTGNLFKIQFFSSNVIFSTFKFSRQITSGQMLFEVLGTFLVKSIEVKNKFVIFLIFCRSSDQTTLSLDNQALAIIGQKDIILKVK